MIIDYSKGIHPKSGIEYENYKDIITTPFWTEDFCKELCDIADFYKDKFHYHHQETNYQGQEGNLYFNTLFLDHVNHWLFQDFTDHYSQSICRIIQKEWPVTEITGWFPAFIVRYDSRHRDVLTLHNDLSFITTVIKLNNSYEGGKLEFPRQGWDNSEVPVGYAQIWPSAVTHPHRVTPVTQGIRYAFTSWTWPYEWRAEGLPFDPERHGSKNIKNIFNGH